VAVVNTVWVRGTSFDLYLFWFAEIGKELERMEHVVRGHLTRIWGGF
jgi:hypothetical protein